MFLFREYAACVQMALMLAGLLAALCGIGYLLKVSSTMCLQMLQAYNGTKVISTGTEPSAMTD